MLNKKIHIAIIVSRFNETITEKLKSGAIEQLTKLNITSDHYDLFDVPGAIEIPLIAKQCALLKKYDAIK